MGLDYDINVIVLLLLLTKLTLLVLMYLTNLELCSVKVI